LQIMQSSLAPARRMCHVQKDKGQFTCSLHAASFSGTNDR
jgi:hypothetical protein